MRAWLGIQKEIVGSKLTEHEWCQKAALEMPLPDFKSA